jgi:hypothetical protein
MGLSPPPEYGLLLAAMSPTASPHVDYTEWGPARWNATLAIAEWHRLLPVLFRHVAAAGQVPAMALDALEEAYLANSARNLFIAAELDRALVALAAADVPAMLLKGAALVETVYADPALREMLDLDILVPAAAMDAAGAALGAIGYRPESAAAAGSHPRMKVRAEHHHDPPLVADHRIAAIELHHHIATSAERAHFDVAGLWERARPGTRSPEHLLPAPEDLLLHAAFHFTRNRLGGSWASAGTGGALSQVCDIAWLVDREPIDWDAFVASARSYRLDTRVFLALFVAAELGVAIPADALDALRPPGFDPRIGRRLIALRVLRTNGHLPVRSLRWMLAPSREVLARGWGAEPRGSFSLARAYVRRAKARGPHMRSALRRPRTVVQDYRLNAQIDSLEAGD